MADLDDFFAKKDRKKSKAVKKFATADEMAKKFDEPKQKPEVRPKKERPVQEGEEPIHQPDEEEWKEYEETIKDYTGLKIQVLQGGKNAEEQSRDSGTEDNVPDNGKGKGPWNKPSETAEAAPPPPPPVEEPKPRETKPSVYVPPIRARTQPEPVQRRAQPKHLPDIHNDDYFPMLGAGAKRGGGWSTAGGAGGASPAAPRTAARAPLALGNRFTSLQDDS